MNQMWVEIGLNAFQINCSDDSRYANDQYHIFGNLDLMHLMPLKIDDLTEWFQFHIFY